MHAADEGNALESNDIDGLEAVFLGLLGLLLVALIILAVISVTRG